MSEILEEAKRVLRIEAQAVQNLCESLNKDFEKAVDMILSCQGKLIVSGMGKSGLIGRKIASTFSSTGTPSFFLHPAESSHGDLGVIDKGDIVLGISYRGFTEEMVPLLKYLKRKGVPLIALTGNPKSPLGEAATVILPLKVKEEACPLKLAPTSSSTATLAMGDALAMAVLKQRGFRREDFAEVHPQGGLGKKLLTRVKDLMISGEGLPLVRRETSLKEVIALMTGREVKGIAGVIDEHQHLIGVITDGDIRRRLQNPSDPFKDRAQDLMSTNPKMVDQDELAEKALQLMEKYKIQALFAFDRKKGETIPVGVIHLQDLLPLEFRS